jgi:hypothetical protein
VNAREREQASLIEAREFDRVERAKRVLKALARELLDLRHRAACGDEGALLALAALCASGVRS